MTDTPTFHVVRVTDHLMNQLAAGTGIFLYPESTCDQGLRAILIPLGGLHEPGEMGETRTGGRAKCHRVSVYSAGRVVASDINIATLTRRAPPEPTWQEDVETLRKLADRHAREAGVQNGRAALARIEKRLAGGGS